MLLDTSMSDIYEAQSIQQIEQSYEIMRQLRPHLIEKVAFVKQVQRQLAKGYHLVYLAPELGEIKALAGFRCLEFLAWGKVLYIDDLITDTSERNQGYGGKLITWLIEQARANNCDQLHLDSGPQRHEAHRLYLNHKLSIIGSHFALDLQ